MGQGMALIAHQSVSPPPASNNSLMVMSGKSSREISWAVTGVDKLKSIKQIHAVAEVSFIAVPLRLYLVVIPKLSWCNYLLKSKGEAHCAREKVEFEKIWS